VTEQSQASTAGDQGSIRAVERAVRMFAVVAEASPTEGVGLLEAARSVALAPTTALRILRTLEGSGFVDRRTDGSYIVGAEFLRLAKVHSNADPLDRVVQPILDELAVETGESSYLAVPVDAAHAVYVRQAPSPHAVRHVSWLGRTLPRSGTALGAALAGHVDESGAAVVESGFEAGTVAIAVPLRRSGVVVGALNVVGPSFRVDLPARTSIATTAVAAARRIEAVIGAEF
jgi:IclR family transcriptional regulator, acetate operon repressor